MPPHVSALLLPLRELIAVDGGDRDLPQIELACGDEVTALVLRHLEPLTRADLAKLRAFARASGSAVVAAAERARTPAHLLDAGAMRELAYALPEFGITHAVQADRLHPGEPADQPGAGRAGAAACSTCSPTIA